MENTDYLRDKIKDLAVENYKNGLNCAECVIDALTRAGALPDSPSLMAAATGFGGGIGLSGYTCGALSAAIMANGAVHGRPDPWSVPEESRALELEKHYRRYNRLLHDFSEANGGVLCREITAPFEDWHSRERRKTCLKLIAAASALAFDYLTKSQEETFDLPYGQNMGGNK